MEKKKMHKSPFPKLLDDGIEKEMKNLYGKMITDMDKAILSHINKIPVKNK